MDRVLRNFVRLTYGALASGELNLRGKGLFRAGRKHHGAISIDAKFQPAQKSGVVVEKANVGSARRHDVPGNGGGEKRLAIDQSKIVDLARLCMLIDQTRLWIRWRYLHQLRVGYQEFCVHATICSALATPSRRISE